jgi:hypothetical protein
MTDTQPTKIALSDVETLQQLLDEVPAHRATTVSKQRAIAMLAPRLHAMRAKGYTWRTIAAWLMDHGLSVSQHALERYLAHIRRAEAEGRRTAARKGRSRVLDTAATGVASAARAPGAGATTRPTANGTASPAPEASPARPAPVTSVERNSESTARRSDFVAHPEAKKV